MPAFTLVDETGVRYGTSTVQPKGLDTVGPGMTHLACLVFQVPEDHHYRLEVSGFWANEKALIEIVPQ